MSKSSQTRDKFPRKFGKYHLLGPLAQGGMGALYLAAAGDRGLERLLVIKTVLPHLADAEYLARFRDEAKVVVKLSHGNLVPVFDAGQVAGELFIAMDFVAGKDLRAMWNRCAKKQVAFPVDVAVYVVKELCRGLAYAHKFRDLELVHRDVSPPNVLISYSGEVKLTDFGLASSTLKMEKTAPGIIYGKVAYMSPEQARGDKLDGRSDLYAAGIVLWELLTGRQLFPPGSEQPQDLLERANDPDVLLPSKRAPRVPASLDAICLRALSSNPADRFSDCGTFREALSGWLAAEAPTTDETTLELFMERLFDEDIVREHDERGEMMAKIRVRALTLPPTDELRRMVEESAGIELSADHENSGNSENSRRETQRKIRAMGSRGRRTGDRDVGGGATDRRGRNPEQTERGLAVDVPKPATNGRTVLTPPPGARASAALALQAPMTADFFDFVGQIIDGRYKILELIGEGGMGRVYLAEHVEIGKRVAVKILHPIYGRMPDLVERFRREARAASKIGHPHIVDVTDSGTTEDDSVYFVMEYLEGVELATIAEREGEVDVTRALKIGVQISRALAAAHAVGIIHRDLKPENVFLTHRQGTSDFVKVLDFGIAKSTEAEQARDKRLTSPGMAMGTPEYMSPEQAAGRPADERCDIYSLGAILYEVLTGRAPYAGDNFMEILTKKATVDPRPPCELRPDLPEAVEELIVRAMARNPEHRPPSMKAFEYELTKCLAGRGTAVAQILGLATDPALIASLSPGLNVTLQERGIVRGLERDIVRDDQGRGRGVTPATQMPSMALAAQAGMPASVMGTDATERATSSSGIDFDLLEQTASISAHQPSSIGIFGWIAMVALLFIGVGVILFVATGERGGAAAAGEHAKFSAPEATAGNSASGTTVSGHGPAKPAGADGVVAAGAKTDGTLPAADASPAGPVLKPVKSPSSSQPNRNPHKKSGRRPTRTSDPNGPPATRREAQALLRAAAEKKGNLKWREARALYQRVASGKHLRAMGYIGLSRVAFETKDTDSAIAFAKRALKAGARAAAWMELGHAYLKRGRYAEALKYYELILEKKPDNKEAQSSASLARRKLGR